MIDDVDDCFVFYCIMVRREIWMRLDYDYVCDVIVSSRIESCRDIFYLGGGYTCVFLFLLLYIVPC